MGHGNANLFRLGAATEKASHPSPDAAWAAHCWSGQDARAELYDDPPEGSVQSIGLSRASQPSSTLGRRQVR